MPTKHLPIGVLVAAIGVTVWFLATGDSGYAVHPYSATRAPRETADMRTAEPPTRQRVAATDSATPTAAELSPSELSQPEPFEPRPNATDHAAEVQEYLDSLDPLDWVDDPDMPIDRKAARTLEVEDDQRRFLAVFKLAHALGESEDSAQLMLDAIRATSDPDLLGVYRQLLILGAMELAPQHVRRQFVDVLRDGDTPAHRIAAVQAVFMSDAVCGKLEGDAQQFGDEMNRALVDAIRHDDSDDVVGSIAISMATFQPTPEAVVALREAAARMPASHSRRYVWKAIGRGTFDDDRCASLVAAFHESSDQAERDDIAAGIARGGNSMSFEGYVGDGAAEQMRTAQELVLTLFRGTSDADVRRDLARASLRGMGCMPADRNSDEGKAEMGRFYRELAALDPDAEQRRRYERLAEALETEGFRDMRRFHEVMYW